MTEGKRHSGPPNDLRKHAEWALQERLKELNCLYSFSALVELPGSSLDDILKGTVMLLPAAWQFPEITEAAISLEGKTFQTARFRETSWMQVSEVIVNGKPTGQVKVCYVEERQASYEGPFLKEERKMLNAIAERLGRITERMRAEEALQRARAELEQRVAARTEELHQANEKLRESEERYRTLFTRAGEGIVVLSVTGKLLEVNESFAKMHGYSKHEMLCIHVIDFAAQNSFQMFPDRVRGLMAGETLTFEVEHYHKDGHVFPLEVSASLISSGGESYIQCFYRDITKRKQALQMLLQQRAELSQVSRLATVGQFAASIAHEVNQPVAAILNNARAAQRFLSSDTPDINEVRDALRDIVDDDRRAAEVIRNLRSFLKRKEANPAILDINTVIKEVLTILRHEVVDRHISVTPDLSPDIPHIEGDRIELQQVLVNLILNGCDSLMNVDPQQRQMRIRTAVDDPNGIIVAVHDSGTGLDANDIDRVFEPFYTTKGEGLGIGLSISKSIIAAHGGRIWAENNIEGGATFYFTLPIYKGNAGSS